MTGVQTCALPIYRVRARFTSTLEQRVRTYEEVRDLVRARWPDCPLLPELDRRLEQARATLLAGS